MSNYPNEIASVVRTQTFFIDSFLSPAKLEDEKDGGPLSLYSHWSRYRFYSLGKSTPTEQLYQSGVNCQNRFACY